jgi:hypothetical protein
LTILLFGTQFIGQAVPLPLSVIDVPEPIIQCMSNAYNNEQTAHKMDVSTLTLGDIMGWIDPTIGVVCDTSGGVNLPDPSPNDPRLGAVNIWRI